jgi:phosphatidylserine/phosphatidylglycerophosphate/cardiolipin synthase-like enzyme
MPTKIHMFLPSPPTGTNYFREVCAYGPSDVGEFHSALTIEIDPDQSGKYAAALAIVKGLIRFIPNTNSTTGTVILKPDPWAQKDLNEVLEYNGNFVFVYRNLDTTSVREAVLPAISELGSPEFLESLPPEDRANSFVLGKFAVFTQSGMKIGLASSVGGEGGWTRLNFEIVYIPGGLKNTGESEDGWKRLKELVEPDALTRRLDPASFYSTFLHASGETRLIDEHIHHGLWSVLTRRTLIEIRNEYDEPFDGQVTIETGAGSTSSKAPASFRGTFVLDKAPPVGPVQKVPYKVTISNHVLTQLPSGSAASTEAQRSMTAPAHWALQTIFMAKNPTADDESKNWFVSNTGSLPRFTKNNKVTPIRDGLAVFKQYTNSIRTVTNGNHFIYLVGWALRDQFRLIAEDPNSTIERLLQQAVQKGATVRAMIWDDHTLMGNLNSAPVDRINAMGGQAILDNETLSPNIHGSHHQKYLLINGLAGAYAFCGGVDINTNRRDSPNHGAEGAFHDVHSKVDGPAVADIFQSFVERWNNHPMNLPDLPVVPPPFDSSAGSVYVQVARTYPPSKQFPFAPEGSLTPLNAFIRAIERARKFIYIEDQYLSPYPGRDPKNATGDTVGVLTALRRALQKIDYLVIVIPNHTDLPQGRFRRQQFIESLRAVNAEKVHVFFLGRNAVNSRPDEISTEGGCDACSGGAQYRNEIYCHSKVWIVDDICAKIGSCNCNRRGYTHDSEMDIVMVDGAVENGARTFARRFRMELWGEHLNLTGARNSQLEDYKLALSFWKSPPQGARIRAYRHNDEIDLANTDGSWNNGYDPDGR